MRRRSSSRFRSIYVPATIAPIYYHILHICTHPLLNFTHIGVFLVAALIVKGVRDREE